MRYLFFLFLLWTNYSFSQENHLILFANPVNSGEQILTIRNIGQASVSLTYSIVQQDDILMKTGQATITPQASVSVSIPDPTNNTPIICQVVYYAQEQNQQILTTYLQIPSK